MAALTSLLARNHSFLAALSFPSEADFKLFRGVILLDVVPDGRRLGIGRRGKGQSLRIQEAWETAGGAQCHAQLAGEGPPSRGGSLSSAGQWAVPTEAPEVSWYVKWHYSGPLTEVSGETR